LFFFLFAILIFFNLNDITIKVVVWSCMFQTQLHLVPMNLSQCTLQLSGTVLNCRADRDLT